MKKNPKVKKRKAREWWTIVHENGYLNSSHLGMSKESWQLSMLPSSQDEIIRVREVLKK